MSLLANAISEELVLPSHREAEPSRSGSVKRRATISERNKVIAASTGAVVTSLTRTILRPGRAALSQAGMRRQSLTPFDVIKTRLQTQAPLEPLFAPSSTLPPPTLRSSNSPWPPPVASTSAATLHPTAKSSSATNLATCCQKTYFSSNGGDNPLLCRFDPRTSSASLPAAGSHLSISPSRLPTHSFVSPVGTVAHSLSASATCIYPTSSIAALSLPSDSLPSSSRHLTGFWDAVSKIVRHEGLGAMWRGTVPALAMSVPGQIVYMISYDWGRRTAFAHAPDWAYMKTSPSPSPPPLYPGLRPLPHETADAAPRLRTTYLTLVPLIAGSLSRTVVAALVSPIELVRTRLQSSTTGTTVPAILKALAAEGGIHTAWRGLPPTLWRDVPFSGIYWAGYEGIKRTLTGGKGMGEGWEDQGAWEEFGIAFVSGAGSGMIAATLTNPFDVVKTRRQALETPRLIRNGVRESASPTKTFAVIADIAKREGPTALMRGITPRLAKVGPACGIMFVASILVPTSLSSLFTTTISTTERSVRVASILGPDSSHLGGHYTVHILAVPTAQLNPAGACYCLPAASSPSPILVPLILNNTSPSRLTYTVTSLTFPPTTKSYSISSTSLITPTPSSKSIEFDFGDLDLDEWAFGSSSIRHPLPAKSDSNDVHDLSPTESLYYLPISSIGIVRLSSLLDAAGVEVRIRRKREVGSTTGQEEGVRVFQCPRAGFATKQAEVHSCLNPALPHSIGADLAVEGYEPLSVTYHSNFEDGSSRVVRGKPNTIGGIKDSVVATTTTGVLRVPMNVSLTDVGKQTLHIDSIKDGCGNVVHYNSPSSGSETDLAARSSSGKLLPGMLDIRSFIVHSIPEAMFGSLCAKGEDVVLLKGGKKFLEITLGSLEKERLGENKWRVMVRFTPEDGGKGWEKEVIASSKRAGIEVTMPGSYEITGVKGKWCEGVVLVPSTCTVVQQPLPSLSTTFEPLLDVCSSSIGVISTLHLLGTPPFTVTYAVAQMNGQTREVKKTFSHSRAEIRFEPGPGEWEYRFTKLKDLFYEIDLPKEDQFCTRQKVQLVGGAQWSDAGAGKTVHSCDGDLIPPDCVLFGIQGTAPWELEFRIVGSASQVLRGITNPRHSFDIAIPPAIAKRGGKFTLSLESVRDGNGCKRPITAQDLAIDVRHSKPTAQFPGPKGVRSILIREQAEAKIPLALTGEGPWTITYQPPSLSGRPIEPIVFTAKQPNAHINLRNAKSGVYTLISVHDQYCPGEVFNTDWSVSTLPKPTLQLSGEAGYVVRNGSVVRKAVCRNAVDAVTLLFQGKPPFVAPYTLQKGFSNAETLPRSLSAIQPRAELALYTASEGHHKYSFLGVGDSLYTTPSLSGLIAPSGGREGLVRLEQDVFALPNASFKHGAKKGFCSQDRLASRGPDDLVVQLEGRAPFEIELEVREEGHRTPKRFTIADIKKTEWSLELPVSFTAASSYTVALRYVSDANGCSSKIDRAAPGASSIVKVAEIASIAAVLPQPDHCVGDFLNFVLQGAPPFTLVYEFDTKQHVVPLTSSKFSRMASKPGVFKILSVGHGEDQCKAVDVDLVKTVHAIPTAVVSEGKDVFIDIREGEQTEIIFSFTGEPPFTFTYSRRHPQDRTKDKTVLETHTVNGIMEHSYSIFTTQEGTWSDSSTSVDFGFLGHVGASLRRHFALSSAHFPAPVPARNLHHQGSHRDHVDVRNLLAKSIRHDFAALTARLDEASFEICYSKWSMDDYRRMIICVQGLQQALITSTSALDLMNSLDPEGVNSKLLLAKSDAAATFVEFRHGIDIVIADVVSALSGLTLAELDQRSGTNPSDLEAQSPNPYTARPSQRSPSVHSAAQLSSISARLRREVRRHSRIRRAPSNVYEHPMTVLGDSAPPTGEVEATEEASEGTGVPFFRRAWTAFAEAQTEAIITLIKDESLQVEDTLRITEGMPSLQAMYSERLPTAWTSSLITPSPLRRLNATSESDKPILEEIVDDDATCDHYGLGVSMFLWGILASYPFYLDSRYYTGALLAANGAGTVIIQEWLYNELPSMKGPYPGPALRAGKSRRLSLFRNASYPTLTAQAIAVMCISIVISALFQIFVFRCPARHQLRLNIAAVTFGLMSYNILLQSNINVVAPPDDAPAPPIEALNKIQRELIKRESKLQAAIIALTPLLEFASMEPKFSPFKGDGPPQIFSKVQSAHSLLLSP
ncbi:hypothetical protein P7C70_g2376, partial [Phenoliferia sp. Uapishka_3]